MYSLEAAMQELETTEGFIIGKTGFDAIIDQLTPTQKSAIKDKLQGASNVIPISMVY